MDSSRPDRSRTRGLIVAPNRGDLIGDIHRQHRRRVLKRAAQFTLLAIALLSAGYAFKVVADRNDRRHALESARGQFVGGTMGDLESAVTVLSRSLERRPGDDETRAFLALARAHLWLEFGYDEDGARAAVDDAPASEPASQLARAVLAFAEGDVDEASRLIARFDAALSDPFLVQERVWLTALVAVAQASEDPQALEEALASVDAARIEVPDAVALHRVAARVNVALDRHDEALAELQRARELAPSHVGLAADEALYNAYVHRELAGVASVADQLLARDDDSLAPRDRAHVQLARSVSHVRQGEFGEALELLDRAIEGIASWDRQAERLIISTAAEAGDSKRVRRWAGSAELSELDRLVFRAWATLLEGDVMKALEDLAAMPQEYPWVGYLQALALVEQGRHAEAKPWLDRTDALLPGRIEIEVARARVELRLGDPDKARRQLEALAEEEPYAPRAWTGLGEAYSGPAEGRDPKKAKRALQRAVDREPVPAEAMLMLGEIWYDSRAQNPEGLEKARELFERASQTNPHLPRYRERLAVFLAELGYPDKALELLRELDEERGLAAATLLQRFRLEVDAGNFEDERLDEVLDQAKDLGADPRDLERERARRLLARGDKESVAEAQAKLLALLESDRADVEARVLCAQSYLDLGDRKNAEATIMKGLTTTPVGDQGRLHLALARLQSRTGRWPKAAPRARKAWRDMVAERRPPSELLDVAELGTRAWLRERNERAAIAIARELTEIMGFHDEAWAMRARAELQGGEPVAARASIEKAIALEPNKARSQATLGDALIRFGLKKDAEAAYRRAVELAAGTPDEKAYVDKLKRL
jgi:Tfp pilus assembly protein PilF